MLQGLLTLVLTMAVAEVCPTKTQRLLSSIITISVVVADVAFDGSRSARAFRRLFSFYIHACRRSCCSSDDGDCCGFIISSILP